MAKKNRWFVKYLIVLCALFAATADLLAHFVYSSEDVGHAGINTKPDAIVVLTGGRGRPDYGLALFRKGVADTLIISGVGRETKIDSIFTSKLMDAERKRIILDRHSTDTYENAVEVKHIMTKNNFKSMELVTSTDHMPRAAFIFKKRMPNGVDIRYTRNPLLTGWFKPTFDGKQTFDYYVIKHIASEFFLYYAFMTLDVAEIL